MDSWEISFGQFRLDLRRRELLRDGQPMRIRRRALGILCALVEANGEIVRDTETVRRSRFLLVPIGTVWFRLPIACTLLMPLRTGKGF